MGSGSDGRECRLKANARPNIIEIIFHDLGANLGCYGNDFLSTPAMDRFAEEGVLLENMFCAAPQCSPSRSSIMTGCYPHANGMMGLAHLGWRYQRRQRTITQILKAYGYENILCGHHHEANFQKGPDVAKAMLGYDRVIDEEDAHHLIANGLGGADPFFLSIGFVDVHRPNTGQVSEHDLRAIELPPYVPDTRGTRKDMAQFAGMISRADAKVGRILDSIRSAGLDKDTIVFITTDHGPEFNRAKMTLYEAGLRVACMFRWPGVLKRGVRLTGMRSTIDILPTLLDLVGVTPPEFIQGRSFSASLLGQEDRSRDYIVGEKTYHLIYDPMRCIRTARFKFIRNWRPEQPRQISVQHSYRMGFDLASELYGRARSATELYDLEADPLETSNLVDDPDHRSTAVELEYLLMTVLRETRDPLLDGDVLPRGDAPPNIHWVPRSSDEGFDLVPDESCPSRLLQ